MLANVTSGWEWGEVCECCIHVCMMSGLCRLRSTGCRYAVRAAQLLPLVVRRGVKLCFTIAGQARWGKGEGLVCCLCPSNN